MRLTPAASSLAGPRLTRARLPQAATETVTTVELRANLAGVIGRVRFGGRRSVVTVHGEPAVELVPLGAPPGDHSSALTTSEVVDVVVGVDAEVEDVWERVHRRSEQRKWWPLTIFDPWVDGEVIESWETADGALVALRGHVMGMDPPRVVHWRWDERGLPVSTRRTTVRLSMEPRAGAGAVVTWREEGFPLRCSARVAEHRRRADELLTALARSFSPLSGVLSAPAGRNGG